MQVYMMLVIANLIEPCMWKLILNHLKVDNCPEFCNGLLDSYCFKLNLRSSPDQSLSNQGFKHNSVHMVSLNLNPKLYFEHRFCMFIINGY